jgi:hypothetical protein
MYQCAPSLSGRFGKGNDPLTVDRVVDLSMTGTVMRRGLSHHRVISIVYPSGSGTRGGAVDIAVSIAATGTGHGIAATTHGARGGCGETSGLV